MRPIRLTVAGMRSYRMQRTLDFTDRTLMAILGDTGSGKSSLLEALYGALYGGSTWDARGLGALIADGVQTLQIQLEFRARGNTYTVARSASRKNYPPSKHVFDGPGGEHLDGEKDVNRRIVELVGLTGQEFLRVVILPQGRFGQLLQGTSGERTPILRGILGLGVLDRVRNVADRQADSLGAALEPIMAARARLYPNPQSIADTAKAASNQQTDEVRRLGVASAALENLHAAATAVSAARRALLAALEPADAIDLSPALSALVEADDAYVQIATRDAELAAQIAEFETQDKELRAKLAAATEAGLTHSGLAKMSTALTSIGTQLPALAQQITHNAREQAWLAAEQAQLDANTDTVRTSAATAKAYQLSLDGLWTRAETAREEARQQSERIQTINRALTEVSAQNERLAIAVDAAFTATQEVRRARSATAIAAAALSSATGELAALQNANAAAHIARGHAPGQPCPVCRQTLPADFNPPEIRGEQSLLQRLEATQQGHAEAVAHERSRERAADIEQQNLISLAGTAATKATTMIQLLDPETASGAPDATRIAGTVDSAMKRIVDLPPHQAATPDQVTRDAAELVGALRLLTGLDAADKLASTPAASPTMKDAEALQAGSQRALEAGQERAQQLMSAAVRLEAEHLAAVDAFHRRQSAYAAAVDRTVQAATDLAGFVRDLPALVSEPLVTALNLTGPDPGAALLNAQEVPVDLLTDLQEKLSSKQDQLELLNEQRDTVMSSLREMEGQRSLLRDAKRETVDRPRANARRSWEAASSALRSLTDGLDPLQEAWKGFSRAAQAAPLPTLTADAIPFTEVQSVIDELTDQQLRAEVASLQARLAIAVRHVRKVVAAAQDALKLADAKTEELLTAAGVSTRDDLTEKLAHFKHELRNSLALHQRATAQVPIADGLDIGVAELTFQLKILRQVKELLSPSAFPQFVVQQRQVALLRIASSLFGQLTRAGYGFGEDFMIVDRRTGQPRHPKTLSGGETFLASLALALALVEISNRSGGQLDCLFLDEGFGSLDSSILGDALDVLRLQATGGRLVGVISHLHAVAAELDDVLVVTKEIEGSSFRWLDPQERDEYLLDEAAAGLLS